jgi:subtilisin family serine protease
MINITIAYYLMVGKTSIYVKEDGKSSSGRWLKEAFTLTLTILLISSLIAPMPSLISASARAEEHGKTSTRVSGQTRQAVEGRLYNVTLITGDVVLAMVADNGTVISVSIYPSDPTKLGQNFLILKIRNSTYVIPSNVNLHVFDLELFNIDLLIREGYAELPYIPLIVQSGTTVNALAKQLTTDGLTVVRKFSILPALAAKIPRDKAGKLSKILADSKDVCKVWLDRKVHSNLDESAPLIGAPDAWELGLNGSGVRIAILDTGIDASHSDFYFPNGTSKIKQAVSFIDYDGDGVSDEPPDDYFGHGTHVASIAAGTGAKSGGRFKGIAYGATLWNVKVLNKEGWGYLSWVIAGIEYATLGPDHKPNTGDEADILSLSLGAYWWTDGTDPLSMACDAAVDLGRIVVVAAGNWGGYFGIGVPATARKVITVGATDKQDHLAWFSSCGPTIDFRVKPDIVAPGVDIWAALAKGSRIEYWANQSWLPAIDVDGDGRYDYVQLSGTSMSTPHVSGAAALLKQLNPDLKPGDVKNILISTANDLGYNVYQQGGGRVNVTSAIDPPVLVDPATISLGLITADTLVNSTITFTFKPLSPIPLGVNNITLTLEATVRDVATGSVVEAATLNATTVTIPLYESRAILLTINTSLPKSIYEGKIVARVIEGPWKDRTVHTILGFTRLNNVTVEMLDREGSPAAYRPIVVFKHNAASYEDWMFNFKWGYTDQNGKTCVYLTDGEFYIVGYDWDYKAQASVWTIADRVSIHGNVAVVLDERSAREVNFDPAKPNQVFASKRSSINYYGDWWGLQLTSLWWYPSTALTYMTSTTLDVSFSYEYYNMDYFNVASPVLVDVPEWHNLVYWESGITPPTTYVADYNSLVERETDYRVPMTPRLAAWLAQHKWSPFEWTSIEFMWIMNVPRSRVEWLTPDVYYSTYYSKYRDPPWAYTPYWEYYGGNCYSVGKIYEAFGAHPLSTHFYIWANIEDTYSDLYIWAHFFQDSYGHFFYNWERWPAGHIKIFRNDTLIYESDESDTIWHEFYDEPTPSKYRVVMDGWSGQYLSQVQHTELEFTVVDESHDYAPPNLYLIVPGLDLNNTHAAGEVILNVYVDDPRASSEADVTVKFSVDGGETWMDAKQLKRKAGEPYSFSLGRLSDVYVSLWIEATDPAGNRISQMVINGFYVKPLVNKPPSVTVLSPNGGEKWAVGSRQTIRWTAEDDFDRPEDLTINLYYSTDGGDTWKPIELEVKNTGEYEWVIPETPSNSCRVKVEAIDSGGLVGSDISDADFTICKVEYGAEITYVEAVPNPVGQGSKMIFNITVYNYGEKDISSATVYTKIYDPAGKLVKTLSTTVKAFKHDTERNVQMTYALLSKAALGDWSYQVQVYMGKTLLDEALDNTFTVETASITGEILSVSDDGPVSPGKTINFTVEVENTGNIIWKSGNAKIVIKIYDPAGKPVKTLTKTLGETVPGLEYTYSLSWKLPTSAKKGTYTYDVYLYYGKLLLGENVENSFEVNTS